MTRSPSMLHPVIHSDKRIRGLCGSFRKQAKHETYNHKINSVKTMAAWCQMNSIMNRNSTRTAFGQTPNKTSLHTIIHLLLQPSETVLRPIFLTAKTSQFKTAFLFQEWSNRRWINCLHPDSWLITPKTNSSSSSAQSPKSLTPWLI